MVFHDVVKKVLTEDDFDFDLLLHSYKLNKNKSQLNSAYEILFYFKDYN